MLMHSDACSEVSNLWNQVSACRLSTDEGSGERHRAAQAGHDGGDVSGEDSCGSGAAR